ncbi:hypothetical protein ACWDX6_05175 [Streptomyces sp. NPDC003027]
MAYRADVAFLEDANPHLIDRNAMEFRRLHTLIESTDDAFRKAAKVEWQSEARDLYVKRLGESKSLADALSEADAVVRESRVAAEMVVRDPRSPGLRRDPAPDASRPRALTAARPPPEVSPRSVSGAARSS